MVFYLACAFFFVAVGLSTGAVWLLCGAAWAMLAGAAWAALCATVLFRGGVNG
ncbi:hypothetical protein Ga0080574_TMP2797 [Salipiger abyssi]|uniref:Uncharacterized protein n=1 Tax=Salipiger abyssi TaxID=1250539 RepID=A0A1P8UUR0_9RHOB|nr:hypothetical protein Ga0080574_TMP2797 [Salipiger abyssi]